MILLQKEKMYITTVIYERALSASAIETTIILPCPSFI